MTTNFEYPIAILWFVYTLIVVLVVIFLAVSVLCALSFYEFFNHHPLLNQLNSCETYLKSERLDLYQQCLDMGK